MPQTPLELTIWDHMAVAVFLAALIASGACWLNAFRKLRLGQKVWPSWDGSPEGPIPGRRPWSSVTAVVVLGLHLFVPLLLVAGYQSSERGFSGAFSGNISPRVGVWLMAQVNFLLILLVPLVSRSTSRIGLDDLGLARTDELVRDARLGLWAVLMLAPVVYVVQIASSLIWLPRAHPVMESMQQDWSASTAWIVVASAVLAAPVAEELVFRGVLLGWFTTVAWTGWKQGVRMFQSPSCPLPADAKLLDASSLSGVCVPYRVFWIPNVLTSFIFAMLHFAQWPAPLGLFVLSLGLGWLAQATGRLGAPIVAHAVFNGFSTVLLILATQATQERQDRKRAESPPAATPRVTRPAEPLPEPPPPLPIPKRKSA